MTSLHVNDQLNPYFETFFLLYMTPFDEKAKQEIITELDMIGIDGESFYDKYFPVIESYYASFEENRVPTTSDTFFQEVEQDHLLTLALFICRHSLWNNEISRLTDLELQQMIIELFYELNEEELPEKPTIFQALTQLEGIGFSDGVKWQLTRLLQQPRALLENLIEAVLLNLPAFELAKTAVQDELQLLIDKYSKDMQIETFLRQTTKSLIPDAPVTPTLAVPMSVMLFSDQCYYGLLSDHIQRGASNSPISKEDLLIGLKAISDKTKLEILASLKEKPSYNLELAEHLSLTPATISHHMNALLNAGFIKIEKKGKSYYVLNEEAIEHFIHELRRTLLK